MPRTEPRPSRRNTARRGGSASRARRSSRKEPPSLLRRLFRALLMLALVIGVLVGVGVAGYLRYLDSTITRTFEGRLWSMPAVIYAQPLELFPGALLSQTALQRELERLGYRAVSSAPRPGSFRSQGGLLDIHLRRFPFIEGTRADQLIRVRFARDAIVEIADASGRGIPLISLDPVAIGSFFPSHGEDRIVLAPEQVPTLLTDTLKAVEDRNFDTHVGFDPEAILRALWVNLRAGEVQQGGSTLTQQLVKSYYLSNQRTLERKLREIGMAIILDARFPKQEILTAYVNEIFLGQDGRRAVHGFGLGSQFYFNKPIDELAPDEIAMLVAVIRGPTYYNPFRYPERTLARRNLVLDRMAEDNLISAAEYQQARQQPLRVARGRRTGATYYPAYMDLVRRSLTDQYRDADLTSSGLRIFTNLNPPVQEAVEQALGETLTELERNHRLPEKTLQGAAIVTSIQTGEVLALAGGRVAGFDGFNRALDARRPIGSLIKPVVYLDALESGYHLASIIDDAPVSLTLNRQTWSPRNYDNKVNGPVPLVRALGDSLNLATVRLGLDLGVDKVADRLEALSGHPPKNRYPSLLLGAEAMTPLEITALYSTIASGGFHMSPKAVIAVVDETGQALTRQSIEMEQRIAPSAADALARGMEAVMQYGTGRSSPFARAGTAGKTGTTDDYRDSWFVGFDGVHLAVIWVGADDNSPTRLTGATGALKVWDAIMRHLGVRPLQHAPANTLRTIDYDTGLLADRTCSVQLVTVPVPADALLRPLPGCAINTDTFGERVRSWVRQF